jgi:hypothetical protein
MAGTGGTGRQQVQMHDESGFAMPLCARQNAVDH